MVTEPVQSRASASSENPRFANADSRIPIPEAEILEPITQDIKLRTMQANILEPSNNRLSLLRRSPTYHQLIDYMEGGEARMDELGVSRQRRK